MAVSLDWLMDRLPAPAVVKIDVEGAELEVLKGASRLFETIRPIVLCEVIPASEREVTAFLRAHDYLIFDGENSGPLRQPLAASPWSTLAIPA